VIELLPPPPPLSTMERARRLQEMVLLEKLKDGDEVSGELWELWYSERGPENQSRLAQTDSLLADPDSWSLCEKKLVRIIEDDRASIYFVEAANRLATLYFLQGRLEESYTLCRLVLQLKPWHFGALSGIVQVCIGRGNRNEARIWAQRRLPTLASGSSFPPFTTSTGEGGATLNPRRAEWCNRAVADAREMLQMAEEYTTKSLGEPEEYYSQKKKRRRSRNEDEANRLDTDTEGDAWQ